MIGWVATIFLICATSVRAFDYSHSLDLFLTFVGCGLWMIEGFRLKNKALIFVNLFGNLIIIFGTLKDFLS